jgi:hypothetical protein
MKEQISVILSAFTESMAQQQSSWSQLLGTGLTDTQQMFTFIKEVFFRNYIFTYFLLVTGNWYAGTVIGNRSLQKEYPSISEFVIPDFFIWFLLGSWTGVLIDTLLGLGPLRYLFWNIALISLFLFGLQGFAIARHLLDKYNVARGTRFALGLAALILFFIPGVNLVLIVGLPGFGLSELWIKYRKAERS